MAHKKIKIKPESHSAPFKVQSRGPKIGLSHSG